MKYILKAPNADPETLEADEIGLKLLQGAVGGYVECPYHPTLNEAGIDAWVNEEGLLIGLQPNLGAIIHGHPALWVGPVVFTGQDGEGGSKSLTEDQILAVEEFCREGDTLAVAIMLRVSMGL